MSKEEIIGKILQADPSQLKKIEGVFNNEPEPQANATRPQDMRLLTMLEVCNTLGLSRMSVWRLTRAGKLKTIETIGGGLRVPCWALEQFAGRAV